MQTLTVKTEGFEGPFDVLFKLIEKNKIDIYDIPIAGLTEQYMEYISSMEGSDMELSSEFIVMAAALLEIKSKMLLPCENNDAEQEDPRQELVNRLMEYKKFKHIAELFSQMDKPNLYFRDMDKTVAQSIKQIHKTDISEILDGADMDMLYAAFEEVLKRKELRRDKIRSEFNSVKKAKFSINEKIQFLTDLLIVKKRVKFSDAFKCDSSKTEVVVTFLAMLELIRIKKIAVMQKDNFDEIIINAL